MKSRCAGNDCQYCETDNFFDSVKKKRRRTKPGAKAYVDNRHLRAREAHVEQAVVEVFECRAP